MVEENYYKKDIFPYEWIDDYKKLRYPRHPPRSVYYSRLHSNKKMIKRQPMKNIIIQKMYGKHLISRLSEICIIITSGKMYYY